MKTFEELGVSPEIRRAIEEMGYENPMPVQEEVIPYLLGENNDVVALAQTGTGKTAAFGLPLLQKTDVGRRVPQSLILCPTRELCLQIAGDLNDYSKYIDGLRVLPVYGGSSIESQIRALKNGVHIIVATPGRLIDLMERKTVSLATIENVVMDEADEMLNMGFTDSINAILAEVPQERNTLLFSATMSPEIARIAKNYLRDAKEITIGRKNEGTANVKHLVYVVHAKDKYAALKRIVDYLPEIYGIIFCRTRKETQEIADKQAQNLSKTDENPHPERITYGLRILELMSDEEYRAFVFASQGLSESQKMLMAQGLYRFTDFYQGRKESESAQLDAKMQRQLKAFGAQNSQIEGFINRYKNAYAQILSEGYLG